MCSWRLVSIATSEIANTTTRVGTTFKLKLTLQSLEKFVLNSMLCSTSAISLSQDLPSSVVPLSFLNSFAQPYGIINPLRISPEVVGHPGTSHLLFFKCYEYSAYISHTIQQEIIRFLVVMWNKSKFCKLNIWKHLSSKTTTYSAIVCLFLLNLSYVPPNTQPAHA